MTEHLNHEEVQDLLEHYVDERLDRAARRRVDEHLATCDRCREVLDGVAPVDLGALTPDSWDERAMRSAVRRSLVRTAVNAAVLLLAGALALLLLSSLVLQPLLVNRGGRAAAATRLTGDLGIMFNPGAIVDDWSFESGALSRTSRARLVMPVGTEIVELGSVESRLTLTGFGDHDGGPFTAILVRETGGQPDIADRLQQLGDGTVATVELVWNDPISFGTADALTKSPRDVRVVWLGFAVDGSSDYSGPGFDAGGVAGGATCDGPPIPDDVGSSGSGGGGGSVFALEPSAIRALGSVEGALSDLLEHPEIADGLGTGWRASDVERAARFITERRVRTMVVTGPTAELLAFLDEARPDFGGVRAVDFFNWFSPLCGR